MVDIAALRNTDHVILAIGSHHPIIQSILDFDFLVGKNKPSVLCIVAGGKKYERFFFGKKEITLPVFSSVQQIPEQLKNACTLFLNLSSGRRVLAYSQEALALPSIQAGVVFAEDVPEEHAITLYRTAKKLNKRVIGPASVGLLIPGSLKLGAIGGVDYRQLVDSRVFAAGSTAVFSASGGMTSEIIRIVALQKKTVSFALAFGGDRFPMVDPEDAFLMAEQDPQTKQIVYFGELGGTDEYKVAELLQSGKVTKPVVAYIAGVISDYFEQPPQFGHAKAMAKNTDETAQAKRTVLREAGAKVADSFDEFVQLIAGLDDTVGSVPEVAVESLQNRHHALFASHISGDVDDVATVLGKDLLDRAKNSSFASIVSSMFLGKDHASKELEECVDFILRLLVDHGPYVSGAVNTMITARAGRDLPSALSTGLLTIGPRFGGAINQAAANWVYGVSRQMRPVDFVEEFAKKKEYIAGIGHKKYRVDMPDPRVAEIISFSKNLEHAKFTEFAQSVETLTVNKKGNLILNVDGAIACTLLDILSEKEGYTEGQLKELIDSEFFNALFILSRSVGFIAHFLDQKRMDEGLFRLPNELVTSSDV